MQGNPSVPAGWVTTDTDPVWGLSVNHLFKLTEITDITGFRLKTNKQTQNKKAWGEKKNQAHWKGYTVANRYSPWSIRASSQRIPIAVCLFTDNIPECVQSTSLIITRQTEQLSCWSHEHSRQQPQFSLRWWFQKTSFCKAASFPKSKKEEEHTFTLDFFSILQAQTKPVINL